MVLYIPNQSRAGVCDSRNFFNNAAGWHLFLNERDSDVAFSVEWDGDNWHLPAHRLVLSSMSEVFRKMFDIDMSEKNLGKITINDSSPLTVKQFLRYLYMGTLDLNGWTEAVDLMRIAHKYSVVTLVALCESYLTTTITFSNACCLYEIAQTYSLEILERQTSALILDAGFIITATEGFYNLQPQSLEHFLMSRHLNMENECCVLTTLKEWAVLQCSRRGLAFTRENILNDMKPFLKHIRWSLIPEQLRTFVPEEMVQSNENDPTNRKPFHVAPPLQYHINVLKFIVELGTFYEDKTSDTIGLSCLKFGVDNHAYVAGFRMVGMFKTDISPNMSRPSLTLGRDDHKSYTVFNLNSLPWTKGAATGNYVWRELTAYLPFPVRVDPFSTYIITLKYGFGHGNYSNTKWPYTRLESGVIKSSVGTINFHCCSECYGITQLFMLPAPPPRNVCNDDS